MLKMNPQEALKCATDMLFALDDDGGSTSSTLLATADALKLKIAETGTALLKKRRPKQERHAKAEVRTLQSDDLGIAFEFYIITIDSSFLPSMPRLHREVLKCLKMAMGFIRVRQGSACKVSHLFLFKGFSFAPQQKTPAASQCLVTVGLLLLVLLFPNPKPLNPKPFWSTATPLYLPRRPCVPIGIL